MTTARFDRLARKVGQTHSRRQTTRLLAGAVVGLTTWRAAAPGLVAADAPSCVSRAKRCKHGAQCCSGLCRKRKCHAAPAQGQCTILEDVCGETGSVLCNAAGAENCLCVVTTRGASFCANVIDRVCATCATDADCRQVLQAADAVCARNVNTACCPAGQNACVLPCANSA